MRYEIQNLRNRGMMRFRRISPCPKCGGKVKVKWEAYQLLSALIFKCGECKYTCLIGMRERPKMPWTLTKEWILAASIRRWNSMCNGDRKYKLIRESLGGRR